MAKIKINVKKQVSKDGNREVLLSVSGMWTPAELPAEYIAGKGVAVWSIGNSLYVQSGEKYGYGDQHPETVRPYRELTFCHGADDYADEYLVNVYSIAPETAEYLITVIQAAGERLHKINQRIAVERALYEGESEILI